MLVNYGFFAVQAVFGVVSMQKNSEFQTELD